MSFSKKKEALPKNMHEKKIKAPLIIIIAQVLVSLVLFMSPTSLFCASGTSITMVNHYPVDGDTYAFVDQFLEQTTAVNTNTTVSVSIDGETPIQMMYQGIRSEIVPDDTTTRDWHTWNLTIPAITDPGKHTFQFFRQYYVWQEADQYWAEFDSRSAVQSFTIAESFATPSPSPAPVEINPIYPLIAMTIFTTVVFTALALFALRKHFKKRKT